MLRIAQNPVIKIALIWSIIQLGGCAAQNPPTHNSKQYLVTVRFFRPADKVSGKIEVITRLNTSFAVETQDSETNHFRFSGTLRRTSDKGFFLDQMELASPSMSAGPGRTEELTLGNESTTWMFDLIVVGGFGLQVRSWPASSTNTIDLPGLMFGTNTGPIVPANVTVGPSNTFVNQVGIFRQLSGAPVLLSSPAAKAWPMQPPLPIWLPCSFTNSATLYTKGPDGSFTNIGTVSHAVTVSAPTYPSTNVNVTVKPL